jgi:hypothetical protein
MNVVTKSRLEEVPMIESWMEKWNELLDQAAEFAWGLFEKDLALTEKILDRTEEIFVSIEQKLFRKD